MSIRSSYFVSALLLAVCASVAQATRNIERQDPIIRDPVQNDPPAPSAKEDPLQKLGRPVAERGKAGPDLVIPSPSRRLSSEKALRRLPDLPDRLPPKSKPAPVVVAPSTASQTIPDTEARPTITEASVARLMESLTTRPRVGDAEGRRIRAELAARGSEARVLLRRALTTERMDVLDVIANLLFAIADEEDLGALRERALQGLTASLARRFADGFTTALPADRSWVLQWFESKNPNLRAEAETRALSFALPSDSFRPLLRHVHPDVRRRALRVLDQQQDPEIATFALAMLDDAHLLNAQAAMALLLQRGNETTWAELKQRVRAIRYDRSWAVAVTVLLEREATQADPRLELADMAGCAAAFSHPDVFVATAGAAAVGAIALRSDDPDASLWLRERVPHLLVRALSTDVVHADLPLLRGVIVHLLQRMSGLEFGNDRNAWKQWWGRVGGSFVPRRTFFVIDPLALDELEIEYVVESEEELRERSFRMVAPAIMAAASSPLTNRWLEPSEMQALYQVLMRSRITSSEWPAGRMGEGGYPLRRIRLKIGERSKTVEAGPGLDHEGWKQLCEQLDRFERATCWQPFVDLDRHANWGELRAQELDWWQAQPSAADQRTRLRELILLAIDDLDPALATDAYWELERSLLPLDRFDQAARAALFEMLRPIDRLEPLHRALLELLAKHSEANVLDDLKTFFALRPLRHDERLILAGILAAAGPQAVRDALEDARPPVLAGAAEAAHILSVDPPLLRLLSLLRAPSLQVRLAAIRSLGRLGAESVAPPLHELCEQGQIEERLEAAEALARLCAQSSLPMLSRLLASDDVLMRRAIFTGFAASDSISASLALASYAVGPAASSLDGLRARVALLSKPLDQVRSVCLSMSEDVASRRSAALLLAEALDREAFPVLISILEEAPDDEGVIQALEWLCCRSFERDTALAAARSFAAEHAEESPQHWFLQSTAEAGLTVPCDAAALRTSPSAESLLALCRVLELGTPDLRMHAARYLREGLREDLGYVTLITEQNQCAEIAAGYRELLQR